MGYSPLCSLNQLQFAFTQATHNSDAGIVFRSTTSACVCRLQVLPPLRPQARSDGASDTMGGSVAAVPAVVRERRLQLCRVHGAVQPSFCPGDDVVLLKLWCAGSEVTEFVPNAANILCQKLYASCSCSFMPVVRVATSRVLRRTRIQLDVSRKYYSGELKRSL